MHTHLSPTHGWVPINVAELFRFKDLLYEFGRRDVKLRYKQTALGIAWVILQPLLAAGFLHFAFVIVAGVRQEGTSSFLFTFAGLLAWNLFSTTLAKTSMSMVGNAYLVTRVYFPRLVLPLSGTMATLLDFVVAFAMYRLVLGVLGILPGWPILALPLWIALILCLALGAGLIAAALTVDYRDVQHILPMLTPLLLYASPVAYSVAQVPDQYQRLFYLINPLASLIEAFRWSALGRPLPPWPFLIWSSGLAIGLFLLGAATFRRTERRFADVI